jgi:ferrous iron transport protein B
MYSSLVVALVGSPNSGKTTLFNWLTGSKFKTVNYPGSTVDYSVGSTHDRYGENSIFVMDTPGTYSLEPKSPDERVTIEALYRHERFGASKLVISIADATLLSRHLFVTKQLIEAGFKTVLAVTMSDLLTERNEKLDVAALAKELGVPVVLIDGRLGGGVNELVAILRQELDLHRAQLEPAPLVPWTADKVESALRETAALAQRVTIPLAPKGIGGATEGGAPSKKPSTARERTRRLDRVLLHPIWGLAIFLGLMTSLFSSIFWAAKPIMEGVDHSLTFVADQVLKISPENLVIQFLANGVIASSSAVLVFVPQIFILFVGIILLEDSGYLARSATLVDRPLSALGLGGRSFVPLLSGYACAVPAMMAARTINSKRERWLTLFILPLMSCSARLPVYALLLSFLFHGSSSWKGGVTLTGIYVASLLVGGLAALIAGRFLKIDDKSFFMLELPVYRRPSPRLVLSQAVKRTKSYIVRAGPAIFVFALIVWVATTFPRYELQDKTERLNASYAAQAGKLIEPIFTPMGGDWRTGVGLLSAFAAREVFVSSLAVLFQVADGNEDTMQETMIGKMETAKAPNGLPLFTLASVLGLIVFFMIALQCLSTVTVAFRESGGWRFAIVQLVVFNVVAYVLSVSLVQGLRALGVS